MNKFCMPFKMNKKYNSEVKEFSINYKENPEQLANFLSFVDNEQGVNIKITELTQEIVDELILIKAKDPNTNFALAIKALDSLLMFKEQLDNAGIFYYIDFTCDNLSFFLYLTRLGVCDIVIGGDLGFQIKDVSKAAHDNNINVRVRCNIAQFIANEEPTMDNIISFFIRPEDIDTYAEYVDTFEFFDPESKSYNLDTIYEVYAKDKKWSGLLSEIIWNYIDDTDNYYLVPNFVDRRLNCGKRCALGKCKLCYELNNLAKAMKEKQIVIKAT